MPASVNSAVIDASSRKPEGDGTVGKALGVLDAVASHEGPVRFAELLAQSELPKATLHRLVQTLANQGMVRMDDESGGYALGPRLLRLAHAAWRQNALGPIARPFLDALSAETGTTVHLAQLDAGQVLYLDKRNAHAAAAKHPLTMYSEAGKVGPAYCTGVGKVLLAYLAPENRAEALNRQAFHAHTPTTLTSVDALEAECAAIRRRGYGFDREEHEAGIVCLAVPVLAATGRARAAISITASTQTRSLDDLEALAPRVLAAAAEIGAAAAQWQFPDGDR